MPEFSFKAVRSDGSVSHGTISAPTEQGATRQLRSKGLVPVNVALAHSARAEVKAPASPMSLLGSRKGEVKASDILSFTAELAVLLRAGLPLDKALKVQIDMAATDAYRRLLEDLLSKVKGGKSLSHAMELYPALFGTFYINLLRSGEASGRLAEVLARLADYLERSKEVRSTVISALTYPAILAVVAVLSIVVMLGFVVPQFQSLFADMGDALPGLTRAVIASGDFIKAYWWLLAIVIGAVSYGIRRWLNTPEGRYWRDKTLLRIPFLGGSVFKYQVARFARTMGTLQGNGVSLLQSIRIAKNTVENSLVKQSLEGLEPAIKGGQRVSDALDKTGSFSPLVIQMVRVGEESGRLDEMLLELARVYDSEVQADVKRSLTLLEPLLILAMGGMIAIIIISILMGILSVNDLAM